MLDGIEAGNRSVLGLKRGAGTTLALAIVDKACVQPLHVGDSGILVITQRGRIKHRTMPHGPVGDAVRAGILDEEDAPWHEESHVVSNLVGGADMWVELGPKIPLGRRDTIVVGSDGLFGNLSAEEIAAQVRTGDLSAVADALANACALRMQEGSADRPPAPDDLSFVLFRMQS